MLKQWMLLTKHYKQSLTKGFLQQGKTEADYQAVDYQLLRGASGCSTPESLFQIHPK
jgi:hypothetical protein